MTRVDNIIVPRWFLEVVEDTLRIQNNINLDKETGETCQDRNIRQSLNGVRKILNGEELTGRERFEKLEPSTPSNLDEAAFSYENDLWESGFKECGYSPQEVSDAFKAGARYASPRWISVDKRLPETDEEVIVLTDEIGTAPIYKISFGHIVRQETYKIKIGSEIKEFTPENHNGWNIPGVKYWMPCPKIPNND